MPTIIPSTALRNEYSDVSKRAHDTEEPIFVTKNGSGDLVVMSIEVYEQLEAKAELLRLLSESRADIAAGRTRDAFEFLDELDKGKQ